ncbi:unnamed protein product, partial [Urochloa humidicola]
GSEGSKHRASITTLHPSSIHHHSQLRLRRAVAMAAANGTSGGKGFEVPKVEVKFTKLFINGQFVDAVSGPRAPRNTTNFDSTSYSWLK